jgi:predicted nucleic acid-binding protein
LAEFRRYTRFDLSLSRRPIQSPARRSCLNKYGLISKIKARYALYFADCFATATAQPENAVILTGDPEFKNVETLVEIDWLTK